MCSKRTPPLSALKLLEIINEKKLSIEKFYHHIISDSSELIPKILDECVDVTESVQIGGNYPDRFVYTPPRPFKTERLHVSGSTNWLNLESFMSCRDLYVQFGEVSNQTEQSFNSFFTKWMNSKVPLQTLSLNGMKPSELRFIINILNNIQLVFENLFLTPILFVFRVTMWRLNRNWYGMKQRDELEFFIKLSSDSIEIHTKQSYLEYLKKEEEKRRYRQTN
uniref:FBA_2 domain-containing protein n=1 Tax=Caenorhabditis tropicalis TaxID=1561998 RepID=A0A1I7UTP4_9PELO